MKPKHTIQVNHQPQPNSMKSTHHLTYLKTVLLIAPLSLYLSGATIAHAGDRSTLSLGFVSPRHLNSRAELPQGYLRVFSATEQFNDGGLSYYAHSSYAIYSVDGKLFKRVENHISPSDEVPEIVSLPVGFYIVEARSERVGYIRIPITIKEGRRTSLDLDLL
jgi:hypothetical protein